MVPLHFLAKSTLNAQMFLFTEQPCSGVHTVSEENSISMALIDNINSVYLKCMTSGPVMNHFSCQIFRSSPVLLLLFTQI